MLKPNRGLSLCDLLSSIIQLPAELDRIVHGYLGLELIHKRTSWDVRDVTACLIIDDHMLFGCADGMLYQYHLILGLKRQIKVAITAITNVVELDHNLYGVTADDYIIMTDFKSVGGTGTGYVVKPHCIHKVANMSIRCYIDTPEETIGMSLNDNKCQFTFHPYFKLMCFAGTGDHRFFGYTDGKIISYIRGNSYSMLVHRAKVVYMIAPYYNATVISGSDDGTVNITMPLLGTTEVLFRCDVGITCLDFLHHRLVVGCDDGSVYIIEVLTRTCLARVKHHHATITTVSYTAGGRLITTSHDQTLVYG